MTSDRVIGIDTGGTYTDGVLLDQKTRQVLAKTKTLTTRGDLTQCILKAIDALLPGDPSSIKLVSISTTLATNAIAEGKGRKIALYLLGYDRGLVNRFHFQERFATSDYFFFAGGHTLEGTELSPLDVRSIQLKTKSIASEVEAIAVSGYFSPVNSEHEEVALTVIEENCDLPVVLGHQLYARLDSIKRATTASLNASLLSILQDFLHSMLVALEQRSVQAPLMIVRGDGGLMRESVARRMPVETIHSGPAASAIGGKSLADVEQALVIDIGGTTTDLALLEGGRVAVSERGTSVGGFATGVRAAKVRSIGLGGDSQIRLDMEDRLLIGPSRVVPLAYIAHLEPRVSEELLRTQAGGLRRLSSDVLEYWFLQQRPTKPLKNERAARVVEMLEKGPLALPDILARVGVFHPLQFDGPGLLNQEIVGRAGLTPTDFMHLSGDFNPWDTRASISGIRILAMLAGRSIEELAALVMNNIHERLISEIIHFLSGHTTRWDPGRGRVESLGQWLLAEHLYNLDKHLGSTIHLKIPIIGLGAPANIVLPRLAESFGTDLILPEHFEVANAIGAVVASVITVREALVIPQLRDLHLVGYTVRCEQVGERFPELGSALEFASEVATEAALRGALEAGAQEPVVEVKQLPDGFDGFRMQARAIGNPELGK
jgi:N-methylhydantoinase A/oxoprolinase/acetone carboxylase beta subunit